MFPGSFELPSEYGAVQGTQRQPPSCYFLPPRCSNIAVFKRESTTIAFSLVSRQSHVYSAVGPFYVRPSSSISSSLISSKINNIIVPLAIS